MQFQWDKYKNKINIVKHGIDFVEASSVFYDADAVLFDDLKHSEREDRFLIIGLSRKLRLVIVSHCYRENDDVIRIISARKATASEAGYYIKNKERLK